MPSKDDPFSVLASTKRVMEHAQFVHIVEQKIPDISTEIQKALECDPNTAIHSNFGDIKTVENAVQLIFIENAVNFCFWVEKNAPKWEVNSSEHTGSIGGWFSLVQCFKRGLQNNIPLLNANYISSISPEVTRNIFKGKNSVDIPLLERRVENLHEAGKVLIDKYSGKFINALEMAENDAVKLAQLIINDFPSFRDQSQYKDATVYFLKRAQICAHDITLLYREHNSNKITNTHQLTAFADYKLPQLLRHFGVLKYTDELARKIDNYHLIPEESAEEIEIRAAAIQAVELISKQLNDTSAAVIDNILWSMSQDQTNLKPYHRTYTIFY